MGARQSAPSREELEAAEKLRQEQAEREALAAREREAARNRAKEELAKILHDVVRAFLARREYTNLKKVYERRAKISGEVHATEATYVAGLKTMIDVFMQPLVTAAKSSEPICDVETVRSIFPQVEAMYQYNSELLTKLTTRTEHWNFHSRVGDVFLEMMDFLKIVVSFVNNYNTAISVVMSLKQNNPNFVEWLAKAEASPACKNSDVFSFLILPIQRVPRYVMLLEDLNKHTPEGHLDKADLEESLVRMRDIAKLINERKREAENFSELVQIYESLTPRVEDLVQPHRHILARGLLTVNRKEYYVFLFTDLIILSYCYVATAPSKKAGSAPPPPANNNNNNKQKQPKPVTNFHFKREMKLTADWQCTDIPESGSDESTSFQLTSDMGEVFLLDCRRADKKAKWFAALSTLLETQKEKKMSFMVPHK